MTGTCYRNEKQISSPERRAELSGTSEKPRLTNCPGKSKNARRTFVRKQQVNRLSLGDEQTEKKLGKVHCWRVLRQRTLSRLKRRGEKQRGRAPPQCPGEKDVRDRNTEGGRGETEVESRVRITELPSTLTEFRDEVGEMAIVGDIGVESNSTEKEFRVIRH